MSDHLTPDQIEKLNDGWHTAIVLGPADFDVMHYALTLAYCDSFTKALWEDINAQIKQRHLLNRIDEIVDAIPESD